MEIASTFDSPALRCVPNSYLKLPDSRCKRKKWTNAPFFNDQPFLPSLRIRNNSLVRMKMVSYYRVM